jgi:hypothetical protein
MRNNIILLLYSFSIWIPCEMARPKLPEVDRFVARIKSGYPDKTQCWVWRGGFFDSGYGCFVSDSRGTEGAHRTSYCLFVGPIAKGKHILHRCDNRPCVNPDHLFAGSNTDNMKDRDEKGRGCHPGDPNHPQTKLSYRMAAMIKEEYFRLLPTHGLYGLQAMLGRKYGVHATSIANVVKGKTWV